MQLRDQNHLVRLELALVVVALNLFALQSAIADSFTNTSSMNTARYWHSGTLLPNGKVLVAGGYNEASVTLSSAELYDPVTGTWTNTGSMKTARLDSPATLLPNGKVLVAGGSDGRTSLASAELYDPNTGTWTTTGSLKVARYFHTATLLANGKVLVVGGQDPSIQDIASAEIYDPATGTWSFTGALNVARQRHTETLLANGKVLVAGGSTVTDGPISSAELYDPVTGIWAMTGPMNGTHALFTATLLLNGKVMVAGGYAGNSFLTNSAELFDPVARTWTLTGAMSLPRAIYSATLLSSGKVLVAGGQTLGDTSSAELYDPATGTWAGTGSMSSARNNYTATLLPNGQVLIAGGINNLDVLTGAELYGNNLGTAASGLNKGLVAYYPFNGNANDASGNGNNGTVYDAVLTADRFGNANSAYDFNGTSSRIIVPDNDSLELTNDFTIGAWINPRNLNSSLLDIVAKHSPSSGNDDGSWVFQLQLTSGPGRPDFVATPYFDPQVEAASNAMTNQWQYILFVYHRTTGAYTFYLNGIESINGTRSYNIQNTSQPLTIGCEGNSAIDPPYDWFFSGAIDDIRIYSRALSDSEVQSLYTRNYLGIAPTPPILVTTNRSPTSAEIGSQTNGNLRIFKNGVFTSGMLLDPSKMTIVLTHGWNSSSDDWPSNMASQFVTAGISANIVAWDWRVDAKQTLPQTALLKTPAQGFELGTNLLQILGAGYSKPIHFIGHSFGTEVNAAAANYLELNGYSSANIQITLFDEAEIANDLRIVSPTTWNLGWIKPLPNSFAWSDNYISLVGELQENANSVNVILTEGQPGAFYISANDLFNDMKAYHAVPCQWYAQTITNPSGSVMGDGWSFERNSNFASPTGGTFFDQQGNGLGLNQIPQAIAEYLYAVNAVSFKRDLGVLLTLEGANAGVNYVGDVTANVIEWSLSDPNPVFQTTPATIGISTYASASPDFWSPQLVLQNHPLSLQPNLKSSEFHPMDDPSPTPSNSPAYVWLPMTIPTNVTSMSFDFLLQGDGASDSVAAALNGTNVFSLATSLIQTNVTLNSGLIDVSQYAGTNVELFLGIVGGTSTNASLTVSGIRLYSIAPPSLQAQASGNNFVLTWPLSASDYTLENSTDLISWTTNANVPVIVNLQNTITNPVSGAVRFYRLIK